MDLSGRVLGGRFELIAPIGEGGYGAVYRAQQLSMDREVAVKIIHTTVARSEGVRERFEREARVASKLTHPNTVVYFDFGWDAEIPFLAMEYVRGTTLNDLLRRQGRIGIERAVGMILQVCGALREAHGVGMVHRDLKPANILLTRRAGNPDFVKVIDFGLAKIVQGDGYDPKDDLTRTGVLLGTPAYMAPEQIRGEDVDARCDLYAVGIIMFLMLSGEKPYQGSSPMETAVKHLTDPIPSLAPLNREVPKLLDTLVRRCMAKNPDERPESADVVIGALQRVLAELGASADGLAGSVRVGTRTFDPRANSWLAQGRRRKVSPAFALGVLLAFTVCAAVAIWLVSNAVQGDRPAAPPLATAALAEEDGAGRSREAASHVGEEVRGAPSNTEPSARDPHADRPERSEEASATGAPADSMFQLTAYMTATYEGRREVAFALGRAEVVASGAAVTTAVVATESEAAAPPEEAQPVAEANTPERRSAPRLGPLRINANPWAVVSCEGVDYGETPVDVMVETGRYSCTIRGPNGQVAERQIRVRADSNRIETVTFDQAERR